MKLRIATVRRVPQSGHSTDPAHRHVPASGHAAAIAIEQRLRCVKICHVITGMGSGGAQAVLCGLLEALRPPDVEHSVVVLGGEAALSARAAGSATIHHLGMRASRAGPRDVLALRRVLRQLAPDVIHAWMYHANLMATLAAWRQRIPVVWGIHHSLTDLGTEKLATRAVIRLSALLSARPARIVYASRTGAAQHERHGFHGAHSMVVPNGYDIEAFAPDPVARERMRTALGLAPDTLVIGMVARAHPVKDHANFLRAAAHFRATRRETVFVLVGEGTSDGNRGLSAQIDAAQLRAHVRLCGQRADVAALNAAFDIATLSSRGEAFPNAIAEAMACGVPCVATDVGDVTGIIGDTGVVVPARDPVALSKGWAKLAELGAAGRTELGMRARRRIVEHYALATVSRRYATLYREIGGVR